MKLGVGSRGRYTLELARLVDGLLSRIGVARRGERARNARRNISQVGKRELPSNSTGTEFPGKDWPEREGPPQQSADIQWYRRARCSSSTPDPSPSPRLQARRATPHRPVQAEDHADASSAEWTVEKSASGGPSASRAVLADGTAPQRRHGHDREAALPASPGHRAKQRRGGGSASRRPTGEATEIRRAHRREARMLVPPDAAQTAGARRWVAIALALRKRVTDGGRATMD
ncbi:hypothetical protein OH77DRAFT_300070 [Trametes cingulata]|nr:hypothetical protein OH77DRAFT_300070 [Trametes cingulata]